MRFVDVINRGGFGRVEQVQLDDGRIVARKVFDPTQDVIAGADIGKLKRRFKREVRVQSSLSGDFVVPVISFDLDDDQPWFTMPLCDRNYSVQIAEDKANGVVSRQPLADILNALEALHLLGFTHRDLKPQNILLHEGRWKLSDFGLVLPSTSETTQLTSTDSAWGTQMYCAPEQAQDFRNASLHADIYSFGCILHDIFGDSLRIPYQRQSCDGPVGVIVEKCTEFNPQKRFKSITAVRGMLFSVLAQPINIKPSVEATEWVKSLEDLSSWDTTRIHDLARYVHRHEDIADLWLVFEALDEETLQSLFNIDSDYWESIALAYCQWAFESSFNFEYCDVVVGRLECIFELGTLDCKAAAALATAELAVTHNRWFVMRRLMGMCGPSLDEKIANRIAIEIIVEEAQYRFTASAAGIGKSASDFHPLIAEALEIK